MGVHRIAERDVASYAFVEAQFAENAEGEREAALEVFAFFVFVLEFGWGRELLHLGVGELAGDLRLIGCAICGLGGGVAVAIGRGGGGLGCGCARRSHVDGRLRAGGAELEEVRIVRQNLHSSIGESYEGEFVKNRMKLETGKLTREKGVERQEQRYAGGNEIRVPRRKTIPSRRSTPRSLLVVV